MVSCQHLQGEVKAVTVMAGIERLDAHADLREELYDGAAVTTRLVYVQVTSAYLYQQFKINAMKQKQRS